MNEDLDQDDIDNLLASLDNQNNIGIDNFQDFDIPDIPIIKHKKYSVNIDIQKSINSYRTWKRKCDNNCIYCGSVLNIQYVFRLNSKVKFYRCNKCEIDF